MSVLGTCCHEEETVGSPRLFRQHTPHKYYLYIETGSLSIALAVLELSMEIRLALNSLSLLPECWH